MNDIVDPQPAVDALNSARKSGQGWLRADCPYCLEITGKEDKRQSLGIKPMIRFFMCWKCGVRGRMPEDAVPEDVERDAAEDTPKKIVAPPGFEELGDDEAWTSLYLEPAREYLLGRGITRSTIIEAGIGACFAGKYAHRVVVPCYDLDGQTWLGFSARDWTNRQALRYRYPAGMPRGKFLYNQSALYIETDRPVLIVEGVFDALPYWPDAVACLGKPNANHVELMAEARRPIAICLDGDAWEEGWALSRKLALMGVADVGCVRLPPGSDPNTVDRLWLRRAAVLSCIDDAMGFETW